MNKNNLIKREIYKNYTNVKEYLFIYFVLWVIIISIQYIIPYIYQPPGNFKNIIKQSKTIIKDTTFNKCDKLFFTPNIAIILEDLTHSSAVELITSVNKFIYKDYISNKIIEIKTLIWILYSISYEKNIITANGDIYIIDYSSSESRCFIRFKISEERGPSGRKAMSLTNNIDKDFMKYKFKKKLFMELNKHLYIKE